MESRLKFLRALRGSDNFMHFRVVRRTTKVLYTREKKDVLLFALGVTLFLRENHSNHPSTYLEYIY